MVVARAKIVEHPDAVNMIIKYKIILKETDSHITFISGFIKI
jgi:hypothetical protein